MIAPRVVSIFYEYVPAVIEYGYYVSRNIFTVKIRRRIILKSRDKFSSAVILIYYVYLSLLFKIKLKESRVIQPSEKPVAES